jgi:hypothetical protein
MKVKTAVYIISIGIVVAVITAVIVAQIMGFRQNGSSVMTFAVSETQSISAFVPGENGLLERRTSDVPQQLPDRAKGETIFRSLREGRCIPDRLKLYDLAFGKDGMLYLNVSKEFIERASPEKEINMTYGIVNSFIESFRGAKSIQLLVEGLPVYTKSGLLYIFEPLEFNRDVMEE